ncbi:MAG TPA: response regulator [Caulobacteraceae bacterium]|jgi:DNA-binding NtrC family response regulator
MNPSPVAESAAPEAGPLLLYVEDELLVRELGVAALTEAGFQVLALQSASEAMAALDERAGDFKAVITDIDLFSKTSGWDVARHARELAPGIPVIYVTGGSEFEWSAMGVPGSAILPKPYAAAQLVVAVATAMQTDPGAGSKP